METQPWTEKSDSTGPEYPVCNISWIEADDFLKKLNVWHNAHVFRLPTEAEWEYACRAGTTTPWSFGSDDLMLKDYAWYNLNAVLHPRPVGLKLPNAWGLYDMHGNVREYVKDWHHQYSAEPQVDPAGPGFPLPNPSVEPEKMNRGGGHESASRTTRCALRTSWRQSGRHGEAGFRAVAEVAQ